MLQWAVDFSANVINVLHTRSLKRIMVPWGEKGGQVDCKGGTEELSGKMKLPCILTGGICYMSVHICHPSVHFEMCEL